MDNRGDVVGPLTHIAVAYHVDGSSYANIGRGTDARAQRVYWRNIAVMAASARRFLGAGVQLHVFANVRPPAREGAVLDRLGVTVRSIPFAQPYPEAFHDRYRGAFHLFDVLEWFDGLLGPDDRLLVVDPDVVWIRDPAAMLEVLDRDGHLALEIGYGIDRPANGVSRGDMVAIFEDLSTRRPAAPPVYIGGELVGVTGRSVAGIVAALREANAANRARWEAGRPTLNTEEHVLTYVLWRLGRPANADAFVRRLATGPLWRNTSPDPRSDEFRLTLWHLPGEKKRGILRLFDTIEAHPEVLDGRADDDLRRYLAAATGIVPTASRRLRQAGLRSAIRIKQSAGRLRGRRYIRPGS